MVEGNSTSVKVRVSGGDGREEGFSVCGEEEYLQCEWVRVLFFFGSTFYVFVRYDVHY